MSDAKQNNEQLLTQVSEMRQRISELERSEAQYALTEKDLREKYEYAQNLFTTSHIPLIVMDAETGVYMDCNEAAVKIYGYANREEILGKTPLDFSASTQYDGSDSATEVKRHIEAGRREGSHVFEWRHQRANGQIWDADVHLMYLENRGRRLIQFQLQDITERAKAQEERERLILELKEALAQVKTLSGLLPICASCKKIRNDQGYWEQMEMYIRNHSEAEFSHGYCPECASKVLSDLKQKK